MCVGSAIVCPEDEMALSTPALNEEDLLGIEHKQFQNGVAMGDGSRDEVLRAFSNLPVSRETIQAKVASLEAPEAADFDIVNLLCLLQHK